MTALDAEGSAVAHHRPHLVDLDDDRAEDLLLVGGKAAALASAARRGLPTLPGVVLTTAVCADVDRGVDVADHPAVAEAFATLAEQTPLVARSSSVVEDTGDSSAAGQFESVLGIDDRRGAVDGVRTVLASRQRAGAVEHKIAVLLQPMVEPDVAGVLFGVDPVTGRTDRRTVTAVAGQPEALVSGEVAGSWHLLDADGRALEVDAGDGPVLGRELLVRLAELADAAAEVFGGPQDIEWAVVDGNLVLLQSRPVTSEIRGMPQGPVYGPGPVAETFPEPLSPLEADLWVPPLDDAVAEALRLAGSPLASAPAGPALVVVVDGWVAIDLERTGEVRSDREAGLRGALRRRVRLLRSAWRVGRLRSALPTLCERLLGRVDADLESLPPLDELTDRQLVALLGRTRAALRSVHAHEVLVGLLTDAGPNRLTGASVAMRVLAEARAEQRDDAHIVAERPVVLALTPPKVAPMPALPARTPDMPAGHGPRDIDDFPVAADAAPLDAGVAREALRLRVRWLQEVGARAAWLLGERLARTGRLPEPALVRELVLADLVPVVAGRADPVPALLVRRLGARGPAAALPARFRISDRGRPIPVRLGEDSEGGTGAGGGRATGPVTHDDVDPPPGAVLVVTTLRPELGPRLEGLAGLVAETGSVLSHLAILAREQGVATVVGHVGATERFHDGQRVTVDGDSGVVTEVGLDGDGAVGKMDGETP